MSEDKKIKLKYREEIKDIELPKDFSDLTKSFLNAYQKDENLSFSFKYKKNENEFIDLKENYVEFKELLENLDQQEESIIYIEDVHNSESEEHTLNQSNEKREEEERNNNNSQSVLDMNDIKIDGVMNEEQKEKVDKENNQNNENNEENQIGKKDKIVEDNKGKNNNENNQEKAKENSEDMEKEKKEKEKMELKIKEMEESLLKKENEIKNLENKNKEEIQKNSKLEEEKNNLNKQLGDYNQKLKNQESISKSKEEENNKLQKRIQEFEKINKEIEDNFKKKEEDYENKSNETNKEINLLKKKISDYENKSNETNKEINELKEKNKKYEEEILLQKNHQKETEKAKDEIEEKYKKKIKEYEEKIKNLEEQIPKCNTIHKNIKCEKCSKNPIKGYRYKCFECDNYNLCQDCELDNSKNNEHPHNFIKLKNELINYSYECLTKKLQAYIHQGTNETSISIILKNNNINQWPKNKTYLKVDKNKSDIDCDNILLKDAKQEEQETYEIHFKNLSQKSPQEYKVYLDFIVDGKKFGEQLCLSVIIKQRNDKEMIKNFKNKYKFKDGMFSDEIILKKLKENKYDFETTFFKLYFS